MPWLYLTLMQESVPQREHSLSEVFNALHWIVRADSPWRLLPDDSPPWEAVYQQGRCWLEVGGFRVAAQTLGRRAAQLRLGGVLSASGAQPRALARRAARPSFPGFRLPHAVQGLGIPGGGSGKFTTRPSWLLEQ